MKKELLNPLARTESPDLFRPKWVKLKKYVELTGDSAAAVHARRRARKWLDGDQCKIVDDALWVNLSAASGWVDGWGKTRPV